MYFRDNRIVSKESVNYAMDLLELRIKPCDPCEKTLRALRLRKDDFTSICSILNTDFINSVNDLKGHPSDYDA